MKLTEAEWLIMNALWAKSPATAREVADRLPNSVNWAYTTIKTMLSRLVDKEVVRERKQGKASMYEPLVEQQQARKGALRSLVDNALGGAMGPLLHFLMEEKQLSAKQRQQLEAILREEEVDWFGIHLEDGQIEGQDLSTSTQVQLADGTVSLDFAKDLPKDCSVYVHVEDGSIRVAAPEIMFPVERPKIKSGTGENVKWKTVKELNHSKHVVDLKVDDGSVKVDIE